MNSFYIWEDGDWFINHPPGVRHSADSHINSVSRMATYAGDLICCAYFKCFVTQNKCVLCYGVHLGTSLIAFDFKPKFYTLSYSHIRTYCDRITFGEWQWPIFSLYHLRHKIYKKWVFSQHLPSNWKWILETFSMACSGKKVLGTMLGNIQSLWRNLQIKLIILAFACQRILIFSSQLILTNSFASTWIVYSRLTFEYTLYTGHCTRSLYT